MAYQFRLLFEGLCAFKERDQMIEAYIPSGHGHGGNLVIPTEFTKITESTWLPAEIATIYEGGKPRQVGIWRVHGNVVSIQARGGAASPKWADKPTVIDFATEHVESSTLSRADIQAKDKMIGVIELRGDSTIKPVGDTGNFELFKNSTTHRKGAFATMVEWSPAAGDLPVIKNQAGKTIVLESAKVSEAWACITNAAPVDHEAGLKHFHMYYLGVRLFQDVQMTIARNFTNIFDCVPPVAWP